MRPKEKIKREWSPEMAYAIGLITADGCLSTDGRHIDFTSRDFDLINSLKDCLGLQNVISRKESGFKKGSFSFRIQFGDVCFYEWLTQIGLSPKKSKVIGELKIPDQYFFDFFRGVFDGDGSIVSYWDTRWRSSYLYYLQIASASIPFLEWLCASIQKFIGVSGNINKMTGGYQLSYPKSKAKKILSEMYYSDSIPCLTRKFVKAQDILEQDDLNNHGYYQAQVAELVYA